MGLLILIIIIIRVRSYKKKKERKRMYTYRMKPNNQSSYLFNCIRKENSIMKETILDGHAYNYELKSQLF